MDLAEASTSAAAATLERPQVNPGPPALAEYSGSSASTSGRPFSQMTTEYRAYLRRLTDAYLKEHPEHADSPEIVSRMVLARSKGFVVSYDELMRSEVGCWRSVPCEHAPHAATSWWQSPRLHQRMWVVCEIVALCAVRV